MASIFLVAIIIVVVYRLNYNKNMQDWTSFNNGNVTNLLAIQSPYPQSSQLDDLFESGSINGAKIGNTLQVGGSGNDNGVFQVVDSNGIVKIQMDVNGLNLYDKYGTVLGTLDASGLTINNGKVTIKNSSNSTIIDPTGINSANNFLNGELSFSGQTTTSQSWTQVTTSLSGINTLSFTLSRQTNVLVCLNALMEITAGSSQMNTLASVYFSSLGTYNNILSYTEYNIGTQASLSSCKIFSLPSGTTTLSVYIEVSNNHTTGGVASADLSYIILGS